MSIKIADFISNVFRKQPISFIYERKSHNFNFYYADVNSKIAAGYFLDTVNEITNDFFPDESSTADILMKFFLRFQKKVMHLTPRFGELFGEGKENLMLELWHLKQLRVRVDHLKNILLFLSYHTRITSWTLLIGMTT